MLAYEEEPRVFSCLMKLIYPEDTIRKFEELDDILITIDETEKLELVEQLLDELENDDFSESFSETDKEFIKAYENAQKEWEIISQGKKVVILSQIQLFFAFFYAYFYNHIALMVHGKKLSIFASLAIKKLSAKYR